MFKRLGEFLLMLVIGIVVGWVVLQSMQHIHETYVCEDWSERAKVPTVVIGSKCYIYSNGELYRPE